jgi:hypothetical protein
VKPRRTFSYGLHGNIGRQIGIERAGQGLWAMRPIQVKGHHLATGMHTAISAAGAQDSHASPANPAQGLFDLTLNGAAGGLALEA